MKCPRLSDLPLPPPGKTGWPWTVETPPVPATLPDGRAWPRISIVTPSYNHAAFIEEAIRCVLLQGYPNLEYFVIDGGSKDASVEIIRKYERWLDGWVSEKDGGQSEAINKGIARCTGEIATRLCTDDQFTAGAFQLVARVWSEHQPHVVSGRAHYVTPEERTVISEFTGQPPRKPADMLLGTGGCSVLQPATFFSMDATRRLNGVREDLHYHMDTDFCVRIMVLLGKELRWLQVPELLATAVIHPESKTSYMSDEKKGRETERLIAEFLPHFGFSDRRALALRRLRQRTVARTLETCRRYPGSRFALFRLALSWPLVLGTSTYRQAWRNADRQA